MTTEPTDDLTDRPLFQPPTWAVDDHTLWETGFRLSERLNKPTPKQAQKIEKLSPFREDRTGLGERLYESED